MQITRHTDYSLRVLLYLSGLNNDELGTITQIADSYGISRNHVVKVVHNLGKLGYVHTIRGRAGGLRLNCAADEINIGELVRQVEATLVPINCELLACPLTRNCTLFGILNEAVSAYLDVLDRYSIADVMQHPHMISEIKLLIGNNSYFTS